MDINIGKLDRRIRIGVAVALLLGVILLMLSGPVAWLMMAIALFLIITATIRVCPIYRKTGFRTDRSRDSF